MKFRFVAVFGFLVTAFLVMVAACRQTPQYMGAAVDHDQNVLTGGPITGITLQDLPPAVKETLKEQVPHAEIALIDKTKRKGEVVYKFTFTEFSNTPKLYVSEDGKVLPSSTEERK